jgi:hypothetical protein
MTNRLFIMLFSCLSLCGCARSERVLLDAVDFGLAADGLTDDAPAIQRMLDVAMERGKNASITIRFPGNSRIYAEPYRGRHLFRLDGFKDIRIEGGGSVFSLHPDLRFLFATRCSNLEVRELNVEMAINPTVEATIISMNADGSELLVRLDEPQRAHELAGPTGEDGEQAFFGMLWLPDTYTDYSYHYYVAGFQPQAAAADASITVMSPSPIPARYLGRIELGQTRISLPVAGVAHRHGPGAVTIIDRCVDVHFEDVEVWSAPWFAYQIFRNTGELVFRRAHVRPQPGSNRITSIWRDAYHVKGNSGSLLFEDCILEGMNDDAFNVSTHNWRVTRILDNNHFEIRQRFPLQMMPFQPRGTLQALSADGQLRLGDSRIVEIARLPEGTSVYYPGEGDRHPRAPMLQVVTELPIEGVEVGSILWDASTANPSVTIRGCVIRNSCRFQSPVTLENNDIRAFVWFYGDDIEGPLPGGSILRNNTFKRGRGNPELALSFLGAMRVSPPPVGRIVPAHRAAFPLTDIVVENNRIYGGLLVDRVHGLTLRGNSFPAGLRGSRIRDCFDMSLDGNEPELSPIIIPRNVDAFEVLSPHPNLTWPKAAPFSEFRVEIATDADFSKVVDGDSIANVSRYVPANGLKAGDYYYRVFKDAELFYNSQFSVAEAGQEVRIAAGSGMAEINRALAEARAQNATRISFEPGTYDLHPGDEGTVFDIEHTQHLIIDGNGSKLVVHDIARFIRMRFSQDITIKNLIVDYEVPLYTAAVVESISDDGTVELTLLDGHPPPESNQRFMEEKRGMFYDPAYPRMANNLVLLINMREEWQALGNNRYRLQAVNPDLVANVKPGMVYICAPRYRPQGIELYNSQNITLADITTYYLPGIGVVTSFADELKMIRVKMLRREDRLLGVQNGGTNIRNARIGPWIEGCRFENTGDDNNHISALTVTPVGQLSANEIIVSPNQPGTRVYSPDQDMRPGDTLAFFDRPAGRVLAKAKIVEAELLPDRNTRILVDQDLPQLILAENLQGFPPLNVTQIYNLERACGNFVFRDNSFIRGRRIGILAKSGPGLIENNRFEELGGGGVEIWNAPFEGLHAHDLLIRNNLFRRNGISHYSRNDAGAAIWSQVFGGRPSPPLHQNIRIIGNTIVDHLRNGIEIFDAVDVLVEDNLFRNDELINLRNEDAHLIKIGNSENVTIRENRFKDSRFPEAQSVGFR